MKRSEAKLQETWDLSLIFKSEKEYESAVEDFKNRIDAFIEKYKGNLNSKETIENSLSDLIKIYEI